MATKQRIIKALLSDITELSTDNFEDTQPEPVKKPVTAKEKKAAREQKFKEHYEQVKVIKWFDKMQNKGLIPKCCQLYRNANTQYLSMGGVMWCKSEGLRAGIPYLTARGLNKTILDIEMKREEHRPKTTRGKGGLNEAQIERFADFEECGFNVPVCYNSEEAIKLLSEFFGVKYETQTHSDN